MNTIYPLRNVFLDTEVFLSNNNDYSNRNFSRLAQFVQEARVVLFTTAITVEEIKANIVDSVKEGKSAIKKLQKDYPILRNSQIPSLKSILKDFDTETYTADLISQFDGFIETCEVQIVSLEGISIESVFMKYFSQTPPFKEGRKKDEFPDAFAIAALELWCKQKNQRMFVVSNDNDWKDACQSSQNLQSLDKLEALFQILEFDDRLIADLSDEYFEPYLDTIISHIHDQFDSLGFYVDASNFSRTVDDEHVENATVEDAHLEEKYVVRVEKDRLTFMCKFAVEFKAEVSFEDLTDAAYDREEGKYYFGEYVQEEYVGTDRVDVEVEILFSRNDPNYSELASVKLVTEDITIELDDEDGYPYK